MKELILGGARSGKSRLAESSALGTGLDCFYIATAEARDEEMQTRILHHRERRKEQWTLIEEPVCLADTIRSYARQDRCLLVDCLTLWLSNCLGNDSEDCWPVQRQALLDVLQDCPGQIIFVSNEVGMGVVPMGELTRHFVDESGWLHQDVASRCEQVTLVVAGLPHKLKG